MYACMHVCTYACMYLPIRELDELETPKDIILWRAARSIPPPLSRTMSICPPAPLTFDVCMHARMHVSMHVCAYPCMYACMYPCMYLATRAAHLDVNVDLHTVLARALLIEGVVEQLRHCPKWPLVRRRVRVQKLWVRARAVEAVTSSALNSRRLDGARVVARL